MMTYGLKATVLSILCKFGGGGGGGGGREKKDFGQKHTVVLVDLYKRWKHTCTGYLCANHLCNSPV